MRTCIICLPRTGSQYCENLISSLDDQCTRLGEYLEACNETEYKLDKNHKLILGEQNIIPAKFALNTNCDKKLAVLKQASAAQNFTLRLFGFAEYNLINVTDALADIGFNFVSLTRDFRSVAISYVVALNSAIQGDPIWAINSQITNPIKVHIKITKQMLDKIYKSHIGWQETLMKLNVSCVPLNYDTLITDITNSFGSVPSYTGNKTLQHDYLTYVVNKNEVMEMIDSYASGL